MDNKQLEQIGDELRRLGHERREVVEKIVSASETGASATGRQLYGNLDQISEQAISLMEQQRALIRGELQGR